MRWEGLFPAVTIQFAQQRRFDCDALICGGAERAIAYRVPATHPKSDQAA